MYKKTWQIHEAKMHFSKLLDLVQKTGMQKITKNGKEVAVILSLEDFDKYAKKKGSLVNFFKKSPCQDVDLSIERSKDLPREIDS